MVSNLTALGKVTEEKSHRNTDRDRQTGTSTRSIVGRLIKGHRDTDVNRWAER